jgi:hypothetical protein
MSKKIRVGAGRKQQTQSSSIKKILTKDQRLIRVLLKRFLVLAALAAICFAAMLYLQGKADSQDKKVRTIQKELRDARSRDAALAGQIESLGAAAQVFANLVDERDNMEFAINPVTMRPILSALKEKHQITTLNAEFKTREQLPMKNIKLDGMQAVRFLVEMNLDSYSDHFLYLFLDELVRKAPGFLMISAIDVERKKDLTIDVLSKISQGVSVETVSAKAYLVWYGFIPVEAQQDK